MKKRKTARVCTCVLLALLLVGFLINLPLAIPPFSEFLAGRRTLSELSREVHAAYVDAFSFKASWIDLNGAYARMTGRRVCHGVSLLKNGMLDRDGLAPIDTSVIADGIVRLSDALAEQGIGVLYVQIPSKLDLEGTLACDGIENAALKNADALCTALSLHGVPVLDLRPLLCASVEDVESNFYRTDHHWSTDGAFCAFGTLLERISRMLPTGAVNTALADASRWERTVYPSWMLGSHGKRVGRFFGGVDDLVLYTPRQSVETALSVPHKGTVRTGVFADVLLCSEYLDAPNYFEDDAYCVYLGGNYPLTLHETPSAAGGAHVLLVKDSFSLPLESMLSTSISRLDAIDPRYYREETVLSYAERTRPDLVVVAINPSVFSDASYWNYGA